MKTTNDLLLADVVPLMRMPSMQRGVFTYRVPESLAPRCTRGAFVRVPFRKRRVWGLVIHSPSRETLVEETKLRAIIGVCDDYLCTEEEVTAVERTAALFRSSLATTAYLTLPIPPAHTTHNNLRHSYTNPEQSETRQSLPPVIRKIIEAGQGDTIAIYHTHQQRFAAIQAIAQSVLAHRQSVLVLTPHRAWLDVLQVKLGSLPVIVIDRTLGRLTAWDRALQSRRAPTIILGTRAAAFSAPPSLGAIVIDGAENDDLKQYDAEPRYDARDVTAAIARTRRIPRLLLTAAPRVVDWVGDVRRLELAPPPRMLWTLVNLIDFWRGGGHGFLSDTLISAITACRADGKIAVLLHNRRGRMRRIACRDCGRTIECPVCRTPYIEYNDHFQCHSCGARSPLVAFCPSCRSPRLSGRGLGTIGVVEALRCAFPSAHIGSIDRDTTPLPASDIEILVASERFTVSVAPTFDRAVGLVAVLHAERHVRGDDYRADERLFQGIRNVAVWARTWNANILVQTTVPKRDIWTVFPDDLTTFYRREIMERAALHFPPAVRLLRLDNCGADAPQAAADLVHLISQRKLATLRSIDGPIVRNAPRSLTSIILRLDPKVTDRDIAEIEDVIPPPWTIDVDPIAITP